MYSIVFVYIKHCLFTALRIRECSSLSPFQRVLSYVFTNTYTLVYEGIRTLIMENFYEYVLRKKLIYRRQLA